MINQLILNIKARQIFDSRGNPTVQVDLQTKDGIFRASVPSGASTGKYQALQLRDNDKTQYFGKGVSKAIINVNQIIKPALIGKSIIQQIQLDKLMVEQLDGSKNQYGWSKQKLGANAILPVSLSIAKAAAAHKNLKLYEYIRTLVDPQVTDVSVKECKFILPCPAFNMINGGKHGGNDLAMQQFMILPTGAQSFTHAMKIGVQIYHHLKNLIHKKYGLAATNVGDQGGFAPNLTSADEALDILLQAITISGYQQFVSIGMDCAASQFYDQNQRVYDLGFKQTNKQKQTKLTTNQLLKLYQAYVQRYPIVSIQDGFDQDDVEGWQSITQKLGDKIQIVGDDLLVTNLSRIENSISHKDCNALLLKVNQIGSLSQSISASLLAKTNRWGTMVSHRSGETQDTFIADLVVGLGTGQIKTGAPCRTERLAKYNQIIRIEEELGQRAVFAGSSFKYPYRLIQKHK